MKETYYRIDMKPTKLVLPQADALLYPVSDRKDKVMIVMSGSEGGLEHAGKCARFLQDNGIPALAIGYFKTKHSPKYLSRISLETIEDAITWLKRQGYEKIGIEGVSKGAEFAAAAAIAYPELSCVVLKVPSWFYSEGIKGRQPSNTSCWSYQGKALPYTPYKTRTMPVAKECWKHREFNILEINTGKQIVPESIILIEKIQAPILMFSTAADTIWPSKESGEKLEQRLREKAFSYPHKHISFDHMSHMMLEYCGSAIRWFIKSEREFPEECAQERLVMGREAIHWIEKVW